MSDPGFPIIIMALGPVAALAQPKPVEAPVMVNLASDAVSRLFHASLQPIAFTLEPHGEGIDVAGLKWRLADRPNRTVRLRVAGRELNVVIDDQGASLPVALDAPLGSWVMALRSDGDKVRLLLCPRSAFLFSAAFYFEGDLLVAGKRVSARSALAQLDDAEFQRTLTALKIAPGDQQLGLFLESLRRHHAADAARAWHPVGESPVPAFVAYWAGGPGTDDERRERLMNVILDVEWTELALTLAVERGDAQMVAAIASHVRARLETYGLADPPPLPTLPRRPGEPAPTVGEDGRMTDYHRWLRIEKTLLPEARAHLRMKGHR